MVVAAAVAVVVAAAELSGHAAAPAEALLPHLPRLVCLREQLPVVLHCTQLVQCKEVIV